MNTTMLPSEHQGVTRTLNRIKLTHNWTGLTKAVENYIANSVKKIKQVEKLKCR